MANYLLAHDLGTSGNKATLYTDDGRKIASAAAAYKTRYFQQNRAEQQADDWWRAIVESSRKLLESSGVAASQIAAIGLSGHMTGCLPLDGEGRPLRPHILWADQRATTEAQTFAEKIERQSFYRQTGHRNGPTTSLAKMLWVREHEPQIYRKTQAFVNAKDYLAFCFTGRLATDPSDASATTLFDIERFAWSEELLHLAGIAADKLPEVLPSTTVLGGVTPQAARETGLTAGTPVVLGGGDGLTANVGAGGVVSGRMHISLGTSAWLMSADERPFVDPQARTFNLCHVVPGLYSPTGTMQAAGSSHAWLVETMARELENPYGTLESEMQNLPPGSNGLLFLPYLMGERAPYWNAAARGAFLGLKRETSRAEMMHAAFEGVALHLGLIFNLFDPERKRYPFLNLVGGGARSDLLSQMLAHVMGVEIRRLASLEDGGSAGTAIVAGVGAGVFADFSAVDRFLAVERVFQPCPDRQAFYREQGELFAQAYQQLLPITERLDRPLAQE